MVTLNSITGTVKVVSGVATLFDMRFSLLIETRKFSSQRLDRVWIEELNVRCSFQAQGQGPFTIQFRIGAETKYERRKSFAIWHSTTLNG